MEGSFEAQCFPVVHNYTGGRNPASFNFRLLSLTSTSMDSEHRESRVGTANRLTTDQPQTKNPGSRGGQRQCLGSQIALVSNLGTRPWRPTCPLPPARFV